MQLEIKTTIDALNPNHVKALNAFLTGIGGNIEDEGITAGISQMSEKPKATRKKAEKVDVEDRIAEIQKVEETFVAPAPEVETIEVVEPERVSTPTLMQIRSLVAQKAGEHKDAIKSKLVELGAQNVSTLDAKHFQTIFDFLTEL